MAPVIVKKEDVPLELLSDSIVQVAKSAKALLSTRLNEDTLVMLIQQNMPVKKRPSLSQIRAVLTHASALDTFCLREAEPAKGPGVKK